ncbi:MAG TPA: CapA family protein, partial [Candidatus Ozemobacteraceae bacterium]|nr:CapA family protein [Candidatus Ozemobacteraceae bacterium]
MNVSPRKVCWLSLLVFLAISLACRAQAVSPVAAASETHLVPGASTTTMPVFDAASRSLETKIDSDIAIIAPVASEASRSWFIAAVGDIMVHETQLKTHWDAGAKQYLFDDDFIHIRPLLASADLMIGNFETTLGGPGRKYSGYPVFNTPDTLAEALKRASFDVLMTSNNHCLDTGFAGLKRTHAVLSGLGFGVIGTKNDEKAESFLVRELNGLKVGLAAYTYETSRKQGKATLNGGLMPPGASTLINSFATETLEANLASMSERIRILRSRGAELIVFVLHWGVEYRPQPTP